ncbi:hypothetical protein [Neobacillus sp. Marseille-QA0830]
MKKDKRVYIPAILVLLISIGFLVYYFLSLPSGEGAGHMPKGEHLPGERPQEGGEIFKTFGTISIIVMAASYSWFRFKKILRSPVPQLKKLSRFIHKAHHFFGWTALIIAIVHGGYYLLTKFGDFHTKSGLAVILLFITLAVYGYLVKRVRNKYIKSVHFLLSNLCIAALLVHAAGQVLATASGTIALFIILWLVERQAKRSQPSSI